MDDALRDARTVSLVTFRKDGSEVATPISPVVLDGKLLAVTEANSWKVKRLARDPRVRVAPCTLRGRVLGPYHAGMARAIPGSAAQDRVRAALVRRFGVLAAISNWLGKLRRPDERRCVIEVTLQA